MPTKQIVAIIQDQFGRKINELFELIEPEPLAAASLAQVHRARLKDNTLSH